jgi:hypothetical protein
VKNLAFRGIAFRHAQYLYPTGGLHDRQAATGLGAALEFEDCANVRIESCEIGHVGEYGVYFKNGCSDSTLTKSHLHDLGGGGVRIGETARPEESRVCHNLVVDNCILQHGGRLHPSACGVVLTHTRQCAVTHCDIGDFYYTGVSAGWNWGYGDTASRETLVENNHVGGMRYFYAPTHAWTSCVAVGALRCLWEMEEDSSLKADYAAGLRASAILAAECLPLAEKFDPANPATFSGDWRSAMMPLWKEQTTEQEAVDLAIAQVKAFGKISPRRNSEANFIREPSAAAWIVSLCPDPRILRDHLPAIGRLIRRHDYARLHYVTFFWVETAWWRMKDIPV